MPQPTHIKHINAHSRVSSQFRSAVFCVIRVNDTQNWSQCTVTNTFIITAKQSKKLINKIQCSTSRYIISIIINNDRTRATITTTTRITLTSLGTSRSMIKDTHTSGLRSSTSCGWDRDEWFQWASNWLALA